MSKERIYGLDLIRLIAFPAIVIYHFSWVFWFEPPDPYPLPLRILELYARFFSFSGFIVVFLSSFLIGFKSGEYKKHSWLPFFLLGAWFIFCFLTYLKEGDSNIDWDIYPLLLVGIVSGRLLLKQTRFSQNAFLVFSLFLLLFPVWEFQNSFNLPPYLGRTLFGQCPEDYSDWPIFPWVGLMWLGMIGGSRMREGMQKGWDFGFRKWEYPLGIFLFAYFWQFKGAYFSVKLGDAWACFTFRQSPLIFWAHMLFWMALIRISFEPRVQNALKQNRYVLALSNLRISRYFFLSYILHYIIFFTLEAIFDLRMHPEKVLIVDSIGFFTIPLTELSARGVLWIFAFFSEKKRLTPFRLSS